MEIDITECYFLRMVMPLLPQDRDPNESKTSKEERGWDNLAMLEASMQRSVVNAPLQAPPVGCYSYYEGTIKKVAYAFLMCV